MLRKKSKICSSTKSRLSGTKFASCCYDFQVNPVFFKTFRIWRLRSRSVAFFCLHGSSFLWILWKITKKFEQFGQFFENLFVQIKSFFFLDQICEQIDYHSWSWWVFSVNIQNHEFCWLFKWFWNVFLRLRFTPI